MDLHHFIQNGRLTLKVIPNAKNTALKEEHGALKLYLRAVPEKNKANKELIQFFKKEFKCRVEIVSGLKSRQKVLQVSFSKIT